MRKIKKSLSLILVLCLVLVFAFSGCGSSEDNDTPGSTSGSTSSTASTASTDDNKQVTLKILAYLPGPYSINGENLPEVFAQVNKKLETLLPNTTAEYTLWTNTEYKQKWDLAIAAGESYDIAWAGTSAFPVIDEIVKGSYKPIDELWEKYGTDAKNEIPDWYLDLGKYQGKMYMVPAYKDGYDLRMGVYMPKTLYDKYWDNEGAIKAFSTDAASTRQVTQEQWDYLEGILKKMKDGGDIRSGFSPMLIQQINYGHYLLNTASPLAYIPVQIVEPKKGTKWDLTIKNSLDLPQIKLMYKTMADWYQKGYIRKDLITAQNNRDQEHANTENSNVMWFHTYMNFENPQSRVKELPSSYKLPAVQVQLEDDFYFAIGNVAQAGFTIPITAKNPERAMQYLNLVNSEKGKDILNLLAYGIEGKDYVKKDGRYIDQTDKTKPKAGMPVWTAGGYQNAFDPLGGSNTGLIQSFDKLNESSIKSPILGLKFDTKPITNEINQIKPIVTQYAVSLLTGGLGDKWETYYNEYAAKLKTAGIDKVINELQKQIDEYCKANNIDKNNIIAQ